MRINAETLDPNMTVAEALAETARVRKEQARARNIKGLAKFREVHHDEILQKSREYYETHRDEINARKRAAYARRNSRPTQKIPGQFPGEKNIMVT
jgi:hypothetical protein